ncbi:MCE family protein [Amycolatopsis anabasis]|uniref:MCE family protein n=1 Tax=Amycolatopsis anabasis TaxID=1840409 RepID=UPI00131BC823|nr:MCE family protein [Amycolatopsis anabasis]
MRPALVRTSIKLAVFLVISVLCLVMVVNTLAKPLDGPANRYSAVFTDAIGLTAGSDVRMGGVRVGRVDEVVLTEGQAKVTFDVDTAQRVPADARLAIRYADMLGARNLNVLPGPSGPQATETLPPGAVVPVDRTVPALDLTNLLNGFKPLFAVLDPQELNQLAGELIGIFQGQGPTVQSLLTRTIAVTKDLASRDQVISGVLRNLNSMVDFTLAKRQDFRQLLDGLNQLAAGLAEDRGQIVDALDAGSALARSLSGLVDRIQPELTPTVESVDRAGKALAGNTEQFNQALNLAPGLLDNLTRAADYGSWVNVYLCNLKLDTGLGNLDLSGGPHSEVCRK